VKGNDLSAFGGEVGERSEPGGWSLIRDREFPASSTGSGYALTDFSSSGGEVFELGGGEYYLSAFGGEVGERSEPGEVVSPSDQEAPASSTGSGSVILPLEEQYLSLAEVGGPTLRGTRSRDAPR